MENKSYIIRVSDHALMELTLAALEAYVVRHPMKKKKDESAYLEAYGLVWGDLVELPDGDTLFHVENATVDAMAKATSNWVRPSNGVDMKKDVITSYWPGISFLGDFHTHPYDHYKDVGVNQYKFSDQDRKRLEDIDILDPDFRISLVLTIAPLQRKSSSSGKQEKLNTVSWTMGHFRFWLTAYIILPVVNPNEGDPPDIGYLVYPRHSDWPKPAEVYGDRVDEDLLDLEPAVFLHVPSVTGLFEATAFGKFKHGEFEPGTL
ncbi:MAG: hypothetical protein H7829_06275 [Magnetococcus sp. THC-1_WYH]